MNEVECVCGGGSRGVCVVCIFCSLQLEAIVGPLKYEHQGGPAATGVTVTGPLPSTR